MTTVQRNRIIRQRTGRMAALFAALVLILYAAWSLLYVHRNWDEDRIDGFYREPKDTLDVVFIGASDISRGFSAGVAFQEYGITSYPFAMNGDAVFAWEAQLGEVMKRQHPDKIVIEINGALYSSSDEQKYQMYRSAVERLAIHLPLLSPDRLQLIHQYLLATKDYGAALRLLIPLYEYHSNQPKGFRDAAATILDNLFRCTDNGGVTTLRGYENLTGKAALGELMTEAERKALRASLDPAYETELRRFLSYCRKTYPDADLLFIRMPHLVEQGDERGAVMYGRSNTIGSIFAEYGYEYISYEFLRSEIGIEDAEDFYDVNHLNVQGMYKFTRFFSQYLLQNGVTPSVVRQENGGISTELTDRELQQWEHTSKMTDLFVQYYSQLTRQGQNGTELNESGELLEKLYEMDGETKETR